ncbi:DUF1572 family protein [Paenibacillus terrigena]|uniref:DUF1572 family protein n=1 Tax=Paenibacillus terrigena TaxID=369333 RepID=UPI0028D80EDA|nr:DUF1572 family protein [Paenibacillus terrigena]
MEMNQVYLDSVKKQFRYYKMLGEKAMEQVTPEQLFFAPNDDSNTIATVVKHLWGNMRSRWTDFLTTDGEKEWRDRDAEFEVDQQDPTEVMEQWNEGWTCLFDALESIEPNQLMDIIYIRNEGHTVMDAINRQLAHYPYHVGQIIYAAKALKEGAWNSLSVPKHQSKQYNHTKFAQDKGIRHFVDGEVKRLES